MGPNIPRGKRVQEPPWLWSVPEWTPSSLTHQSGHSAFLFPRLKGQSSGKSHFQGGPGGARMALRNSDCTGVHRCLAWLPRDQPHHLQLLTWHWALLTAAGYTYMITYTHCAHTYTDITHTHTVHTYADIIHTHRAPTYTDITHLCTHHTCTLMYTHMWTYTSHTHMHIPHKYPYTCTHTYTCVHISHYIHLETHYAQTCTHIAHRTQKHYCTRSVLHVVCTQQGIHTPGRCPSLHWVWREVWGHRSRWWLHWLQPSGVTNPTYTLCSEPGLTGSYVTAVFMSSDVRALNSAAKQSPGCETPSGQSPETRISSRSPQHPADGERLGGSDVHPLIWEAT